MSPFIFMRGGLEFEPVPLILVRMVVGAALPIPLLGTAIATRMDRPGRREVA